MTFAAILNFILTNPTLMAVIGGVIAAFGWGVKQKRAGRLEERNANRAKEADAYEQHLKELENAANAGNAVRPADPDELRHDPYNRDR